MSATATLDTGTAIKARSAGGKLGALAGLAFAFLFFMGTAMLDIPHGVSDQKLTAWWSDSGHQWTVIVSMISSSSRDSAFSSSWRSFDRAYSRPKAEPAN